MAEFFTSVDFFTNVAYQFRFNLIPLQQKCCLTLNDLGTNIVIVKRVDLFAVVCAVFCHFPKCGLVHIRIKREVGTVKLV